MKTTIRIDNIELFISGLSNEIVKKSFAHFDEELSLQAGKLLKRNYDRVRHSDTINGGSLDVHKDIQPPDLRRMIAERILKSIVQEGL